MPRRISANHIVRKLFAHVAAESGLPDRALAESVSPHVPAKTLWHLRVTPPTSVKREQLVMIARAAANRSLAFPAEVIGMVRDPRQYERHPFYIALLSRSYARSTKAELELERNVRARALTAGRICLFDRSDSFEYLSPVPETPDAPLAPPVGPNPRESRWLSGEATLHYARTPRIYCVLTETSLAARVRRHGDAAIEHLLGGVESGENSLIIARDSPHVEHRAFRGVLAGAAAAVAFDRSALLVLPRHQRSIRLYEATAGTQQADVIADAIRQFRHLRQFRAHAPTIRGLTTLLRNRLTYRLPGWPGRQ